MKLLARSLSLIALLGIATVAHAQTIYSGADLNAGPGDPHPISMAAATQFDTAAAALGTVNLITFESAPAGSFTSLNAAPGVTLTGQDVFGNPLYVRNTPNFPAAPRLDGFNVTPGGTHYVELMGGNAIFTFSNPIQAFGAYLTGVQLNFFQSTITFNDGTNQTINVPAQQPSNSNNGSLSFVGFTDAGKFISQVTISAGNSSADFIGIDDVRFVLSPSANVPEPGSVALFVGMASVSGMMLRRRRK